ncbi:MAG TPA: PIN domain-containing protein [Candidatus Nanoarchaeia archaeon]|nr:PIN domain-containing protein [Candidatus Nanoarchaeia archaeon]
MKYCADTWFLLKLFNKDTRAKDIINELRYGKARLTIPCSVIAETVRKLMQQGASEYIIKTFLGYIEPSEKIEIIELDQLLAVEAAKISLAYGLAMMDAFVAVTCATNGCDVLLSGDSDYAPLVKRKYLKIQAW